MPDECWASLNRYTGGDREGAYGTPGFSAGGFFRSPGCCRDGQPVDVQMTLHPYDKYDWLSNGSGCAPSPCLAHAVPQCLPLAFTHVPHPSRSHPLPSWVRYPVPDVMSMEIAFNEPRSRGRVSITSNDSFAAPLFEVSL